MWWVWIVAAFAQEPVVEIVGDAAVVGRMVVAAPPEVVRGRLADPAWLQRISIDGTTMQLTAREGSCFVADYTSPHFLMTVRYKVRQCPTANGVQAIALESNAFKDYTTSWSVRPDPGGSAVEYRISMTPKISVPSSLVTRSLSRGVEKLLGTMRVELAR
jgi:hypothetical protein